MEENGYFRKLSGDDFYHGHFINFGKTTHFASLDAFLADVTAFLYHTDESMKQWDELQASLPPAKKTPRSLYGSRDGKLIPAIQAIDPAKLKGPIYAKAGTIYSGDIANSNPGLTQLEIEGFGKTPPLRMEFSPSAQKSWDCEIDNMFYIRPDTAGRFKLETGESYDIYLLCTTDEVADQS